MINKNIAYSSQEIYRFYSQSRNSWDELYPSEKYIFEKIYEEKGTLGSLLDVGCACGGLGLALQSRFKLDRYTGVDINKEAIQAVDKVESNFKIPHEFFFGDILDFPNLPGKPFQTVVSLSCADWNVETKKIIRACWDNLSEGGFFIISLRLSHREGIHDISKSYQYIHFDNSDDLENSERAPYVVFNVRDAFAVFCSVNPPPSKIIGFGYWGKPSSMARTPYDRLVFSVLAIQKSPEHFLGPTVCDLKFPMDLFPDFFSQNPFDPEDKD